MLRLNLARIRTPHERFEQVYPPEAQKEFPLANPLKRPGTPMEIAESVIYLSASSGSFITGEVVTVDGGGKLWGELWTAGRPDWYRQGN